MTSWSHTLDLIRAARKKPAGWDLRKVWRVTAFRRHRAASAPVARALAFRNVLDQARPRFYAGEKVCGSKRSFFEETLPKGITEDTLKAAAAEHDRVGQRDFGAGFDHTLADYPTLLRIGINGYREQVRQSAAAHKRAGERDFLEAVAIGLDALAGFIRRYAEAAERRGDPSAAERLRAVAGPPPATFRQAVQLVWMTHIAFVSEGRYAMALGRLDQYLLPFYRRDIANGNLTEAQALDVLCHLWIRMEELAEVTNICTGGQTPDGHDATNELSFLCLEATRLVQSPHTNLSARFHDGTPDRFHRACFNVIRTGVGFPAIFNDHVLVDGLIEAGIPPEIARDHCMVGCIETMLAGRQQAWSDSRFNTLLSLLKTLRHLREDPSPSWEKLMTRFRRVLARDIAEHVSAINAHIARYPPARFPDPFLSALTRDCIGRARDINDGGAEFPRFHGICIMGLATLVDSLTALQTLVFDKRRIPFSSLMSALDSDFAGAEPMRQRLLNHAPKYGTGEPAVDTLAARIVRWTSGECLKHKTADGGRFMAAMAANISNIAAGKATGATPDGRKAGTPLSDAASPYFGRDVKGPTAFLRSVATPDYRQTLSGSVINMKFQPEFFQDEDGASRFGALTRFFVRHRIPELQFNFTDNRDLLAAQKDPEKYRSMVVRVSGFSAYFVELSREVQQDVIRRRAHG